MTRENLKKKKRQREEEQTQAYEECDEITTIKQDLQIFWQAITEYT